MATDMVDLASVATEAAATPAAEVTPAVESPAASSSTDDLQVIDSSTETPAEESTEVKETETHNADGTEKTPEQVEKFKTEAAAKAAGAREQLPTEVRSALKSLKDSAPDDPKIQAAVKTLHGAYERWNAALPMLGKGPDGGVNGLKSYLDAVGVKTLPEAAETLRNTQELINTVTATDELLYAADEKLWDNVIEDLKANGHEEALGKLAGSFAEKLKQHDPDAFYSELAKPLFLASMDEAGMPSALNALHKALVAGDTEQAKAITKSIAKFYTDLRDEQGEAAKISKERAAWEAERTSKETESQKAERTKIENGIAESCEKVNNTILGKSLGGFLRLPFFKDFPYETKVDLGNGIKDRLYAALKADKGYQTAMSTLWKAKTLDRAKMEQVHKAKLEEIGDRIVRETVQARYPGYAKGGSAAGKAAAATAKREAGTKAANASVVSGKPIYVASRPENLIRNDVKIGGRTYTASDLQVLQISGKGFVQTTDGKSVRFVTWRKQS